MLGLKLSDAKRPLVSDTRKKTAREVVLDGIGHQIAALSTDGYTVTRTRCVRDAEGKHSRASVSAPPKPWWWQDADGTYLCQIKYGSSQVIEIEAGKGTIVCGKDTASVSKVLGTIKGAVEKGMLDTQIDAARAKTRRTKASA